MVGRAQKIQFEGTDTKSGKRRRVSNGTKRRLKAKIIVAGMFLLEMKTEPQQKPDLPAGTVVVSTGGTAKTGFTFASSVSWYPQLASVTLRYICAMGAPRTAQPEAQGSRQDNCVAWTLRGMECMTRDADLGFLVTGGSLPAPDHARASPSGHEVEKEEPETSGNPSRPRPAGALAVLCLRLEELSALPVGILPGRPGKPCHLHTQVSLSPRAQAAPPTQTLCPQALRAQVGSLPCFSEGRDRESFPQVPPRIQGKGRGADRTPAAWLPRLGQLLSFIGFLSLFFLLSSC